MRPPNARSQGLIVATPLSFQISVLGNLFPVHFRPVRSSLPLLPLPFSLFTVAYLSSLGDYLQALIAPLMRRMLLMA